MFRGCLFFLGLFFLFLAGPAWAEDGVREWRPIYDLAMRWINFGIFIYFLVKVAGPHLSNFLSGQKTEIQGKIEEVRKEKEDILAKVQEARDSFEKSGPHLEEIKSRILEQGERRKQQIIDDANEHSRLMMKNAQQRINNQITYARNKMANELVDMAMEKALERLPGEVTDDDNNRLIQNYLSAASTGR